MAADTMKSVVSLTCAIAALSGFLLLAPKSAGHQIQQLSFDASGQDGSSQASKTTVEMRRAVYNTLEKSQALVGEKRYTEAHQKLAKLRDGRRLSPYEIAQTYNLDAYAFYQEERYGDAIRAYENLLAQGQELPGALIQSTLKTMSQLYFTTEEYDKALTTVKELMAMFEDPAPDIYMLLGQAYFQKGDYDRALGPVRTAIDKYRAQGRTPKENWLLILRVIHYKKKDFAAMVTVLNDLIRYYPKDQYILTLAATYSELGDTKKQLELTESLYDGGSLKTSKHLVNLANLYLMHDMPYKAAVLMEEEIANNRIDSNPHNLRLLSQARYLAAKQDYELTDLDATDVDDRVALHAAAYQNNTTVVERLITAGADVNTKDNVGRTALHWAADQGNTRVVGLLIAAGADVNVRDGEGTSALQLAAHNSIGDLAKLLIAHGPDVNAKDSDDRTALYRAAYQGHTEVVELLITAGADVDAQNNSGWSALHWAATKGHIAVVELLITAGVDVDAKASHGRTALYQAATKGHMEVVDLLIVAGADADTKDSDGRTALYLAAYQGHSAVLELLITAGADVDAKASDGRTALYEAATKGHIAVVDLLITAGADVNAKASDGFTALHWAAYAGNTQVLELLIAAEADVNAKTDEGGTALHWAVDGGYAALVELLIAAGADVNARDVSAVAPLDVAQSHDHKEIIRLLRKHGAK